ncbi:hypothetical protein [Pseudomonas sp. PH1b]|uniref:hypothetical protein n=1 Tax=Pseudomonas sp. PH1b TaxID=1397282 RepID=UPI000468A9AF|nr:hypothetical protein [Pseudomonas sp. PH1b]
MESFDSQVKPSIYAKMAYELILRGVHRFQSETDRRLFLNSLLCQSALFARMLSGEEAFQDLLDRLKNFEFETEFQELVAQVH